MFSFIKNEKRRCWESRGLPGFRATLAHEPKSPIACFEIEYRIETDSDYYYKTIYYETLHIKELKEHNELSLLKSEFKKQIRQVTLEKVKEYTEKNGR